MQALKETIDYALIPDKKDDQAFAIRILNPTYLGIVYRYETLKIEERGNEAYATFDYTILAEPEGIITDKKHFEQFISSVLHDIIYNASATDQVKRKELDGHEHSDGDTETPSTE